MQAFVSDRRVAHFAAMAILSVLAAWLVYLFGRIGYMPLDQSIIFDGAWRLLNGQVPYRDFDTPNGIPVMAMQAVFFLVGGVSWKSYLLHAQVINALFAVAVYFFVFSISKKIGVAFIYGALAALFFYPPFGVPYMDQHAFFFGFLAILAFHLGLSSARIGLIAWALIPPLLVLAFLSKQTASLFVGILLGVGVLLALFFKPHDYRKAAWSLGVSALVTLLILLLLGLYLGISWNGFWEAFFNLPSSVGHDRLALQKRRTEIQLISRTILLTLPLWLALPLVLRRHASDQFHTRMLALIGIGLAGVTYLFVRLTWNQPENGLAFVIPAVAVGHVLLSRSFRSRTPLLLITGLMAIFLALLLRIGVVKVNQSRTVSDFRPGEVRSAVAVAGASVSSALEPMEFLLPAYIPGERTPHAYRELIEFLSGTRDNFLLIGDASILYGLTGHPSPSPALWFHEGLTFPRTGAPMRTAFEERLANSVEKYRIRYLVVDGAQTTMGTTASDFAPLRRCLADAQKYRVIGNFTIFEINSHCVRQT